MIDFNKIKLIIWDLDDTLWEGTLAENTTVQLHDEFVKFINESLDRGIVHSICSKNDFNYAKNKLTELELWDLFVFPSINWDSKGERIKGIISNMNLRPTNILFVDDNTSNLREASYYCPEIQLCTPSELFHIVNKISEIKKIDTSRPRLKQYRVLETKTKFQETFSSNEEFLMSCNIRVNFHNDCIENLDRIHDLIMRSNQLNYTKFRQSKDELSADLSSPNTVAAYVTVTDSFGDYGIVGFYMLVDGKLVHFLFSCRTLGMLVEQYTYMKIGCPLLNIEGDVVTQLNTTTIPKWINQESVSDCAQSSKISTGNHRILFKGPCDISQIFSFIEQTPDIKTEFTYVNDKGISIEGYNHTSQIVTSMKATSDDKVRLVNEAPWIDFEQLSCSSWNDNDAVVYSLLNDGNLGIYQHKELGWQISLCESYYDITNPENWDKYINKDIFTSSITFTKEDLISFSNAYKFIDNSDGEVTINNLDIIYETLDNNTKLILMLGSEFPFKNPETLSYNDRHILHKILNDKVKKWATGKNNVYLIEINNYISSQRDYTDTINHFQKRIYYKMTQDVLSILNNKQDNFKMKSKQFLYYSIFRRKFIDFIKKIIKKN